MKKYRGIVREIYEYEFDVDAKDKESAIAKLKKYYGDDSIEGVFLADGNSYSKAEFIVRRKKQS